MAIEIPDAAIEAVADMYDTGRLGAKDILEAALPHLRAAILGDLRGRGEKADRTLKDMAESDRDSSAAGMDRRLRLAAKAEGVRLMLSYIDDEERTGQR